MKKYILAALSASLLLPTGCSTWNNTSDGTKGALIGTVIGTAAGAIIGHQSGHRGEGALIGAGVGALGGFATGKVIEDKKQPAPQTQGIEPVPAQ